MARQTLEIWGDLKVQNRVLQIVTLGALLSVVVSVMALLLVARKPPFIVRVTESGQANVVHGSAKEADPTAEEARYFAQKFLKLYLAPSLGSVSEDLSLALALMAPEVRTIHTELFKKNRYVQQVERAGVKTGVYFGDIVASHTEKTLTVTTQGILQTQPKNETQGPVSRPFSAYVVLQPCDRAEWNPNGLLVVDLRVTFSGSKVSSTPGVAIARQEDNRGF